MLRTVTINILAGGGHHFTREIVAAGTARAGQMIDTLRARSKQAHDPIRKGAYVGEPHWSRAMRSLP